MDFKIDEAEMNRIYGAFYGQIIGDALGCGYEFQSGEKAKFNVNAHKKTGIFGLFKKPFLPMLGGGYDMKPGQFTDDSEMALCLARFIVKKQNYDQIDVSLSYAYWMHTAPVTARMTTKNALLNAFYAVTDLTGEDMAKYIMENKDEVISPNWGADYREEQKQKIFDKIQANVKKYNGHSLSNGALMRISPLAIAYKNATPKEGPVSGNIVYRVKEGSSQWWAAIQVRNHAIPILKMAHYKDGNWVNMAKTPYNHFLASNLGTNDLKLRIEAIDGTVKEDTIKGMRSEAVSKPYFIQGDIQF